MAAWQQALTGAARAGCFHVSGSISDHLILRVDHSLLRDLEIPEFGQPVALGTVIVWFLSFSLW